MTVKLIEHSSFAPILEAAGICRNSDNQQQALMHALKAGHKSLLEQMIFSFKIEDISRVLTHQFVRHRIASFAQQSQRHCKIDIHSIDWYIAPATAVPLFHTAMQALGQSYLNCIEQGMPMEDARYLLPNGTKSKMIVTMNASSLDNFFKLRCCKRAQWEIRALANEMLFLCDSVAPQLFGTYPDCANCKEPCNG